MPRCRSPALPAAEMPDGARDDWHDEAEIAEQITK
jgi:hypothetical protein